MPEYARKRMAMIFNEWAKRYSENPKEFSGVLDENGKPIEDYGENCALYFCSIAADMDAAGLLPTAPIPVATE